MLYENDNLMSDDQYGENEAGRARRNRKKVQFQDATSGSEK